MMTEDTQDQAALYALGLLDADEAVAFERALAADGELRKLTDELREAAASLARTVGGSLPPAHLRARVLASVSVEKLRGGYFARGSVVVGPRDRWLPWAIAAALAIGCVVLSLNKSNLERRLTVASGALRMLHHTQEWERASKTEQNSLKQVSFCALDSVPAAQQTGPQAAVLWDAAQRRGRLQIQKLPLPGSGKDYQLWTVEAGHKNPISAGVVKVDADGGAAVEFQPGDGDDAQAAVTAFALSVERAGGVPQNEGPILFLGKLP